jgi:hypothetical protein
MLKQTHRGAEKKERKRRRKKCTSKLDCGDSEKMMGIDQTDCCLGTLDSGSFQRIALGCIGTDSFNQILDGKR